MTNKKALSILLITYNHEKYVAEAVQSILCQKIPDSISSVEIVVCDDNSTDKTVEIIRSHDKPIERLNFRYLPQQPNIGITRNYQRGFLACRGDYIAVLEGDDYWQHEEKLIEQIRVLENDENCQLCSTNYIVRDEFTGKSRKRVSSIKGWRNLSVPELIEDNLIGNFSTCMYRSDAVRKLPEQLFNLKSYDWIVNICVGMQGDIVFLHQPMSTYRLHASGNWSNIEELGKLKSQRGAIGDYDRLTGHRYSAEFKQLDENLRKSIKKFKMKGPLSRAWRGIKQQLRGFRK